ncbi:cytochrome P450 4A10-like [Bemisia tabaci]
MVASWIFIILAKRPDIHQKVYEEIVEVCGQEVTLNDVSKLVYLDMVIKEALRHFTILSLLDTSKRSITLEDNTTLPAGLNIVLFIFDLHHNPEYWQKPSEFYPEHFSPVNELNRPDGVFLPFLAGPRICPGKKYSETSMKYWIAKTLLRYEFLTDEKLPDDFTTADYICTFALCPISGFQVKVQERMLKMQTTSLPPQ